MTPWVLVAALSGALPDPEPVALLRSVRERRGLDTLRLDLAFSGARPSRSRIGIDGDPDKTGDFLLEFENTRFDSVGCPLPSWLRDRSGRLADRLLLTADLDERTPWSASWQGDTLCLVLLDRVDRRPFWWNPWFLGATGALLVGGGVIAWMSETESTPASPSPTDDRIPAPDIAMPR